MYSQTIIYTISEFDYSLISPGVPKNNYQPTNEANKTVVRSEINFFERSGWNKQAWPSIDFIQSGQQRQGVRSSRWKKKENFTSNLFGLTNQ